MVCNGIVSGYRKAHVEYFGDIELIVATCPGTNGNSGSPLLDMEGEVVGVWIGTSQPPPFYVMLVGFGVSVPAEEIKLVLENAVMEQ
jgi:S1-C subfamily serine protease